MRKKSLICKVFGHKWGLFYGVSSEPKSKDPSAHCSRCGFVVLHALEKLKEKEKNRRFNAEFSYYKE